MPPRWAGKRASVPQMLRAAIACNARRRQDSIRASYIVAETPSCHPPSTRVLARTSKAAPSVPCGNLPVCAPCFLASAKLDLSEQPTASGPIISHRDVREEPCTVGVMRERRNSRARHAMVHAACGRSAFALTIDDQCEWDEGCSWYSPSDFKREILCETKS
ncbi:hypothetical protein EIP86_009888 [Pleurotus ostreatoroseus]|nr:hypothetical protein EIP86_009888 [Pleurotus ostreatoroseus]